MTNPGIASTLALAMALQCPAALNNWSLPFQGIATDSTGRARPDGTVAATFEIFDAPTGGNSIWTETDQVVLKKGVFSLDLGLRNGLPLDVLGRRELWLSVALAGDAASPSRIPLGRSAEAWYASRSGYAGSSGWSDTANHARTSRWSDSTKFAPLADSTRSSRRSDTADFVRNPVKTDSVKFAARSGKSDSATYASKAPFGLVLDSPLERSANGDTLRLKAAANNNSFLTWDGSSWVAKSLQIGASGSNMAFSVRDPYQVVNFIIALEGIFPSRPGLDPYLGEIQMVGFDWAPRGWAKCDGQLLSISQNSALFALLGTTYGGNGQNTFGLPDLRGRSPVHAGTGPGLSNKQIGERAGAENATLTNSNLPMHIHPIQLAP